MNPTQYLSKIHESDKDSMDHVNFGMSVEIDPMVFHKIMHWVNKEDYEVSGLGSVVIDQENNTFRIVDAVLLQQTNSHAETELDAAAIGKAMHEHISQQKPGELKWWWHSHVDMGVFWSGTDHSTIKQLGSGGWFVATVFNKKREMKSAFVQSKPIRLIADDVSTQVNFALSQSVSDMWDKEYDDKVEMEKSFTNYTVHGGDGGSYGNLIAKYRQQEQETEEAAAEAEDAEEEPITLDELFAQHTSGEISDADLYAAVAELDDPDEATGFMNDDDDVPVLTAEEARAMDLYNHGRTFDKEPEDDDSDGGNEVPLI